MLSAVVARLSKPEVPPEPEPGGDDSATRKRADALLTVEHRLPERRTSGAEVIASAAMSSSSLSDPDRAVLTAYGAYGEKQLYGKTVVGVIRSTFVIDPSGLIEVAQYGVRATGHVAKLRRDLGLDVRAGSGAAGAAPGRGRALCAEGGT